MKFLCDAMLGGLAKWLRAAGHDTCYASEGTDISDRALLEKALDEDRVLLTCDGGFLERGPVRDGEVTLFRLPQDIGVEQQLALVVARFDLDRLGSRCMECNGELDVVPPEDVAGEVPPGVIERQDDFFCCRDCGRVFWHGSHWDRIGGRLRRVFGSATDT